MSAAKSLEQRGSQNREDAGRTLARYAATLPFTALPSNVVRVTKQCILDTLGTTLAATTLASEAPIFHDYVREVSGGKECTLIGYGEKAPAQMAAFLNGTNSHLLDFDDTSAGHPSVATVPVAFVMAEKTGRVSGCELLTAVAIGIDIHTRIYPYDGSEDWVLNQKFSQTQSIGYVSGAAVASRVAGLSEEQTINAMGIAYQQVSGSLQRHVGMQAGWCGQGAVLAAIFAGKGVAGVKDILEGSHGFFRSYLRNVEPNYDRLLGNLGTDFLLTSKPHAFKAWPFGNLIRRPVNAILDLRKEHNLQPDEVETINVFGGTHLLRLAEPVDDRRQTPHSSLGKYSVQFTVATAMVYGHVKLHNYTETGLKDPKVLEMTGKVRVYKDENPAREKDSARVAVRMRDGNVYQKEVKHPLGDDRENPMSQQQIEDKFRDCASFAARPISKTKVEQIVRLVSDLEKIPDIREITGLL